MALSIDGTGNGTIGNLSVTTTTGNIVSSGDSGTITAGMLDGGQSGSAPAYVVRAWILFNGTGTISITNSANVSSITDISTGRYTVTFTTAMPSSSPITLGSSNSANDTGTYARSSTSVNAYHNTSSGSPSDASEMNVVVIA